MNGHQAAPPVVRVRNLVKRFRRTDGTIVPAIDDVTFDLAPGEFMVLLGPSGCGKTTLLRTIAGLERPDSGDIEVQGQPVFARGGRVDVPAERRPLSMVFQFYALWPHMSVFDNIAYPLRSLPRSERPGKAEIAARVEKVMEVVGIGGLGGQHPHAISGGQQQRVALCRALVADSALVLFDEPLSNIDAQVREQLRGELLLMQRELGFAALFVTHDRQEAMSLADSVVVLEKGRIAQSDAPDVVYGAPRSRYVARFIGPLNEWSVRLPTDPPEDVTENVPDGPAPGQTTGSVTADTAQGPIRGLLGATVTVHSEVVAVWRPEAGVLTPDEPVSANRWKGVVEQSSFYGPHTEYVVRIGEARAKVLIAGERVFPRVPACGSRSTRPP